MACLWDSQLTTILCTYLEIHCSDPCFSYIGQNRKQSDHPTWPLRGSSHIQPALLPAPALHDEWPQQLPSACESHAHSYPSLHSITEEAWFAGEGRDAHVEKPDWSGRGRELGRGREPACPARLQSRLHLSNLKARRSASPQFPSPWLQVSLPCRLIP